MVSSGGVVTTGGSSDHRLGDWAVGTRYERLRATIQEAQAEDGVAICRYRSGGVQGVVGQESVGRVVILQPFDQRLHAGLSGPAEAGEDTASGVRDTDDHGAVGGDAFSLDRVPSASKPKPFMPDSSDQIIASLRASEESLAPTM